ncbi:hypothetical protein L7F22_010603 [Adiantum nelumboides]|nr:hypothetical protein [Adiantum nelumboides]
MCCRQGSSYRTYSSFSNFKVPSSRSKDKTSQNHGSVQPEHLEKMVEDANVLPVARELQQDQQDMIVNMRRCSYMLFVVGVVHTMWGSAMFLSLQETLNHAVMTEVCRSSLVTGALAYQLRHAMKPIQLPMHLAYDILSPPADQHCKPSQQHENSCCKSHKALL